MAFDFPNSPTVGQVVTTPGGQQYQWDAVKWGPPTAVTAAQMGNVGRNLIHNPYFNVQQRGTGNWTTVGYTADRWYLSFITTGGAVNAAINTLAASTAGNAFADEAAQYIFSIVATAGTGAGDATLFTQRIENVRRLSGKTITVSFWAWAASAGLRMGVELQQNFGTGGSPSTTVSGIGSQSFALVSGTPQRFTATINMPSVSSATFGTTAGSDYSVLGFWVSAGSSNTGRSGGVGQQSGNFFIWGVQLEIGSAATPLEKIDPGEDLRRCQRFYQTGNFNLFGQAGAANAILAQQTTFIAPMRAVPTMATTSRTDTNIGSFSLQPAFQGYALSLNSTASGQTGTYGAWTATADL